MSFSADLQKKFSAMEIAVRHGNVHLPRFTYDGRLSLNSELLLPLCEDAPRYDASKNAYEMVQEIVTTVPQGGVRKMYGQWGVTRYEAV